MLLQVKDLDISYGARRIVEGVSFTLEKGEILTIVGESGSGKTTVIRAIMGCLPGNGWISGGSILFNGKELTVATAEERRTGYGVEISMIFQDSGSMLNPVRKIGVQFLDYIRVHSPQLREKEAYDFAVSILERVHLADAAAVMESYPFELSGGMRQRVGIAMAIAFNPMLLLGDEPTSALDVTTQAQIIRQLIDIRNAYQLACILVTHNIGVASYISDKIIVMQNGKIIESGSREQIISHPQQLYTKKLLGAVPSMGGVPYVER